jgi:5-methylcytosine-specific restriction endonuclease McrA
MASTEAYRGIVVARAGGACEYCRLLEKPTGITFHIDHVIPKSLGGRATLANLALNCPGCNLSKGERRTGRDYAGNEQPLFNPREYEP